MESQSRKEWEKEQRRNRIIDIAQELMLKEGYSGITIEEIARTAGYNKRTIYLYFIDKEDIFLAVVLRGQHILKEALQKAFLKGDDNAAYERLGRAFFNFSFEHPGFFALIMEYESRVHVYYGDPVNEDSKSFRTQCQNESNEYGRIVTDAIESDLKAGVIKSLLTPRQLMIMLWAQIFGVMQILLMRRKMFRESFGISHEEFFEYFLSVIRRGLKDSGP